MSDNQIVKLPTRKKYLYTQTDGDGAGPRSEIFLPSSANGNYVEVGTVIFEIHRLAKKHLNTTRNAACGGGFGLERIAALSGGSGNIYEGIAEYRSALNEIAALLPSRVLTDLFWREIRCILDLCRALYFIEGDDPTPASRHRRGRKNRLRREFWRLCTDLGIEPINVIEVSKLCFTEIYRIRHEERMRNDFDTWQKVASGIERIGAVGEI